MSRRSLSPAALLPLLLAACGQSASAPSAGPIQQPQARQAAAIAGASPTRPGNFNALAQAKAVRGAAKASAAVPRGSPRAPVHMNDQLGVPSFMWAQPGAAAGAVAAARAGALSTPRTPVEAARAHLAGAAAAYGLTASDAAKATVTRVHDSGRGPIIVSFRQAPGGREVFREEAGVAMARDLSLVAISGALSPAAPAASAVAGGGWSLDAPSALAAALTDLTGEAFAAGDFRAAGARGTYQLFDLVPAVAAARAERFARVAGVRQVWFRLPAGLQPAWHVEVAFQRLGAAETLTYGSVISATDGALLFRKDHQETEAFGYRVWASDAAPYLPDDGPQGLAGTPHPTALVDGYQAPFVAQKLVTLQNVPFSRNDPWLPPGATTTSGNNVFAYADLSALDHYVDPAVDPASLDVVGTVSAPGLFDHAYDTAAAPAATPTQLQAAITQLFYDNNALHDWFYDVGFDEAAGNAQVSNLARGGAEGDPLLAEAQDYSGTNNANMTTPPDGFSPWMQMYVWNNGDLVRAVVSAPAPLAGIKRAQPALFGPQAFERTGDLLPTVPANACLNGTSTTTGSVTNDLTGKIALIDRGVCSFALKVKAAQGAGAVGVLVRNVITTSAFGPMGGVDATITIPSLLIGKADGDAIGAALLAGDTVNLTLQRVLGQLRDGSVDNLIVAHEWGHYLTNRLVQDSAGLDTTQARGMGEGWSDFVALLQAVRAEDALAAANAGWSGVFGTAGYVGTGLDTIGAPNQGYYYGIRRTPYSTDMTRAPLTFGHVADGAALPVTAPLNLNGAPNSEVHNAGEVWATVLWECYAALLRDTEGATPRLTFGEASLRMRAYLVASLKLLPQSPTFLEGRDALLAAAFAGDRADFDAFWSAFAKRGFGVGAVGPSSRFTTTNAGVVETFQLGGELVLVGVSFGGVTSGCDDRDGTLDDGETGTLSITLRNLGSSNLQAGTALITSTNPHVSFPGGGLVQLAPTAVGGTGVATATVSLAGAAVAELADFTVTIPAGYLAQPTAVPVQLRTNVDVLMAASATDTLEGGNFVWTPSADPALATGALFERRTVNAVDHSIFGPDVGVTSDLRLTSPPLQVGAGPFTVAWKHLFAFEADAAGTPGQAFYDGGVVELSDDDGATWIDVGAPAYNGTLIVGDGIPYLSTNPLAGRPAFVDSSPSLLLTGLMDPVSLDLTSACTGATACAGRTVRFRFRIGSDQGVAGPVGWSIDDVAFGGLVNTPFDLLTPDARRCVNRTPTASAGLDQVADEGSPVTLDASASSDLDAGTTLSYSWTQTSGPAVALLNSATVQPTFTAPAVDVDTVVAFVVTVGDGIASSSAPTLVTVRNVNRAPVAAAGPDQAVDERTVVTLDGTASSDADPGTTLVSAWSQTAGPPVALLGPGSSRPSFNAPEVAADTQLTFSLVVGDGLASSPADTVNVTVRNVNRAPVAAAGAAQSVDEGSTVTLDASASSDPDGTGLTFVWVQTGGPGVVFSSATVASPTFTAPQVDGSTLLAFRVTVSDGVASSEASVSVLVRDVNATPVARAGPAQSAPERSLVTLDGSGSSDADAGTILGYTWTQVQDGAPVASLIGADSARPAFTAPDVDPAGAALTFSLVVSDGAASSAPATVVVSIANVNRPPLADAGPSIAVEERSSVLLGATGTDPDAGSTLTFGWRQVSGAAVTLGGADTATPTFTAPEVGAATDLLFEVAVSDGTLSATSQVAVLVTNVNRPPVAQAGPTQTVDQGTVVNLDATASSDPDAGAVLAYAWTQTAGPGVALTGAATAAPTFTAPTGEATLTFQVAVSDGAAISTATVSVTVVGAKAPGGGGCGCSAYGSNPAGLLPFLFGLAFLRRRRGR